MNINLYQEYSKLFLGLTLGAFKEIDTTKSQLDIESDLNNRFYYVLERSDCQVNRKFQANLKLADSLGDKDYKEWLVHFAGPDGIGFIKPKPIITLKTKPKPKITKIDVQAKKKRSADGKKFVPPTAVNITISEKMGQFLSTIHGKEKIDLQSLQVSSIKETINKYIYDKNLQDLNNRQIIQLDQALKSLFSVDKPTITYQELSNYIKLHYNK